MTVTIHSVRVVALELPLRASFSHHLATRSASSSVLVALELSTGEAGWGEALPREYVTGESLGGTLEGLATVAPRLVGTELPRDPEGVESCLVGLVGAPSVRCALELAMLDALGRTRGVSVLELLGGPRAETIGYSAVIPSADPPAARRMLARAASLGLRQIKLKAGKELADDLVNARAARELCAGAEVRIDANGAWSVEQAVRAIPALQHQGAVTFEQPLAAGRPEAYLELQAMLPRPADVVVDESAWREEHVRWFCQRGGASGVNLKVSKLGGLGPCLRARTLASASGLRCQLGAHVGESSIAAAAGAALGALAGDFFAHEGAAGVLLLVHDVTEEPLSFGAGGVLDVAALRGRAGLGVDVDELLVARAAAGVRVFG